MIERSMVEKGSMVGPKPAMERPQHVDKSRSVRPRATATLKYFEVDPQIEGFGANVKDMYTQRGLRSFVQGFGPTLLRQMSNSMVRFTTYNFLKQALHPKDSEPLGGVLAFAIGFTAGAVQVAATQPIDVIKTRMQSINGKLEYSSSLHCAYKIFALEGPVKLWTGALPRLVRVTFSGGIVFAVYETVNNFVAQGLKENPFASKD